MAKTLAACNQKGGVGKSTSLYHIARAAVLAGHRVLVVDADTQGNISMSLTEGLAHGQVGLADALSSRAADTIRDVTVPGVWDGLDVVPTDGRTEVLEMVRLEIEAQQVGRESRLREALAPVQDDYDLILIDCGPSLDQLTINALTAADEVVIVTMARLWSMNGLSKLLRAIDHVKAYSNPALDVAGIIINGHEAHTLGNKHWAGQIGEAADSRGLTLFAPPVPKSVAIADSTEASQGLDEWGVPDLAAIYTTYLAAIMERN